MSVAERGMIPNFNEKRLALIQKNWNAEVPVSRAILMQGITLDRFLTGEKRKRTREIRLEKSEEV